MKYAIAIAAAAAVVRASPFPQGVTQAIAPSAAAPSGCQPTYPGTFGIAVMNLTSSAQGPVAQAVDGQAAAATETGAVSTIADGQPQAPSGGAVSTIADGQPQAPTGVPAVSTLPDGQPQAPTGTVPAVSTIADGQPQAPTGTMTMGPINQIGDGQVQNQVTPVNTLSDGQPQNPAVTATPVNTLPDGQPQNPTGTVPPVNTLPDGQPQNPTGTVPPVNTLPDGQPQNPTGTVPPVNTLPDGQPQNPTGTVPPVNTLPDGQPQNPTGTPVNTLPDGQPQNPTTAVGTQPDGQPTGTPGSGSGGMDYVACKASDSLQVTLADGILTDNQGRIGYIASNYQFQFDGPPQAGAIYTAGFSVCGNGSLALGGSSVFYQCLSGDFYNLYDRNWAPQCNPINIQAVQLIDC